MMKTKYIKPMTDIHAVITEKFICNSKTTDSASIGSTGSPNEKSQDDIDTGGPGKQEQGESIHRAKTQLNTWEELKTNLLYC